MEGMTPRAARRRASLLGLVFAAVVWAIGGGVAYGYGYPAIVSIGDSYISGEAGRWAGNTNNSSIRVDALGPTAYYDEYWREGTPYCHRSLSAEIRFRNDIGVGNFACSGSKTYTTTFDGKFKPGIDFYRQGSQYLGFRDGQALVLESVARNNEVKLVVLSIGGNDLDFGKIVEDCIFAFAISALEEDPWYCSRMASTTEKVSGSKIARVKSAIIGAILNVRRAMINAGYYNSMYTLIVQTYPSPIPNSAGFRYPEYGITRQRTGGCGFWNVDADWANNTVLPALNGAVRDAVAFMTTSYQVPNIKLLRLESAFNGRRLCESTVGLLEERGLTEWRSPGAVDRTEWVSQVRTTSVIFPGTSDYEIQEGLHPNYWGQLALRNCLRQAYNGGVPRNGTCVRGGGGLNGYGEPNMTLQ